MASCVSDFIVGKADFRPSVVSAHHARHDRMVSLVRSMHDLQQQLASAGTDHEKTALKRQIAATDRQIDELVYALYGLTEDEIRIVEEATA